MQKSKYYTITKDKLNYTVTVHIDKDIPLYRYRRFNEFTLSDLINDQLSFSTPDNFNDPYDSMPTYDAGRISEIQCLYRDKLGLNISDEEVDYFLKSLMKITTNVVSIASFSETIRNEIMWAHYADCGKGFALEYDCSSLKSLSEVYEDNQRLALNKTRKDLDYFKKEPFVSIAPVIYSNRKYDMTDYVIDSIKYQIDNKLINKNREEIVAKTLEHIGDERIKGINETVLLSKSKDWQYEREWRLIISNPNYELASGFCSLYGIRPRVIYLGEFINEYAKQVLMSIAKEKDIKIHQMQSVMTKTKIKLVPKKL